MLSFMRANLVLWIYIVLLVVGGLIGFLKAGSKVSLIMSVVFAALLSLCATRVIFQPYVADILLAALLVVFGMRLAKTKKFMPSGLMLILTCSVMDPSAVQALDSQTVTGRPDWSSWNDDYSPKVGRRYVSIGLEILSTSHSDDEKSIDHL